MRNLYFFLVLWWFSVTVFGQISPVEKDILSAIDRNAAAALELLKTSVNINSGTMNTEGVKKVGQLFRTELDKLGFETRWIPGEAFGRAGHLWARYTGRNNQGPNILLIGHLDTVFEWDSPFQSYTMQGDSLMHGPGALDMKGGDVIMLLALRGLKETDLLDKMAITVIMSGDEELSGTPLALSKKDLCEAGDWADVAIGFEDGDGRPENVVTARRGYASWEMDVNGLAAHSSQVFSADIGSGAIFEAARLLEAFYGQLQKEEYLTINPGIILGGNELSFDENTNSGTAYGKNNIVSRKVIIRGDLRTISADQLARAKKQMLDIAAENLPHTRAKLVFGEQEYPPMSPSAGNDSLLRLASAVSRDLGYGPLLAVHPSKAGAADISFVADRVEMAIDGMGLSGSGGHTPEETADVRFLPIEAKRTAILLYRLARQNRE